MASVFIPSRRVIASNDWRSQRERLAVRVDPPGQWFESTLGAIALATGLGFGARIGGIGGALLGGALGAGVALLLRRDRGRKRARRREIVSKPFPESWQSCLRKHYSLYARLPDEIRHRFEMDVAFFIAEKRITGIGIEVSEELKLLVAASAVTLSAGWPDYEWDQLAEVLLYPDNFDRDYQFGRDELLAGEAHPWGILILSVPSLLKSFEIPDDGYHVGLHEFAHLLDKEGVDFDGIPPGLDSRRIEQWIVLQQKEMELLREGRSVLDPYGAESPAEFLAVSVEGFFERAAELERQHPELYQMLSWYFALDPASWER